MKKYIEILKKLNNKAKDNGDIPVSCIILKNGEIIAKAYNKRVRNLNPLDHAEIIAIKKASKKLNTYNLIGCEMIVTLKPCKMCEEIIKESKIKKVTYILDKNKNIIYKKIDDEYDYFLKEIKDFFVKKR